MRVLLLAVTVAWTGSQAPAQVPVPLIAEGDVIPGAGEVIRLDSVALNSAGEWMVDARIFGHGFALIKNGTLFLLDSQDLPGPPPVTLTSFDEINLNASGHSGLKMGIAGTPNCAVFHDTTPVIFEGDLIGAAPYPAHAQYDSLRDAVINDSGSMAVIGLWGSQSFLIRLDTQNGDLVSTTHLYKTGDVIPGQTDPLLSVSAQPDMFAINESGHVLFSALLEGPPTHERSIFLNDTLLARQGHPSPIPGRNYVGLSSADVNNAGDWVLVGDLDGDAATSRVIVKNGDVIVQRGDSLPAIAPYTLSSIWPDVDVADNGDVLWSGRWDIPSPKWGLFLDDRLLVESGVTVTSEGHVVTFGLSVLGRPYAISDDGETVLAIVSVLGVGDSLLQIDLGLGASYCSSAPNSSGSAATITALGSASIADADLSVRAAGLPPTVLGLFAYGTASQQVPFGSGTLCIAGATQRLPVRQSDSAGVMTERDVFSQPMLNTPLAPGMFYFQAFYRDPPGFNLSNGLALTLQL